MSLTADDLIRIPIDPELLHAAAAHTARSLQFTANRHPRPSLWQLRRRASAAAVELIVRRWLDREQAPYRLACPAPVTDPDQRILVLGGKQATVVVRFLPSPTPIDQLDKLLDARVPTSHQARPEVGLQRGDLMIFAFLEPGGAAADSSAVTFLAAWPRAARASLPSARRFHHIRSKSREPVRLELAGIGHGRELATGHIHLAPFADAPIDPALRTVLYLHSAFRPAGGIELVPEGGGAWAIAPQNWGDLIPLVSATVLAGWMTVGRRETAAQDEEDVCTSMDRRRQPSTRVRDLRPMKELTDRLRSPR